MRRRTERFIKVEEIEVQKDHYTKYTQENVRQEFDYVTEEQGGFRSGGSYVEQILALNQLDEKCREMKKQCRTLMCLENAYDRVYRGELFMALDECGV